MYFICKICGRSLRSEEKPNWCYFDRGDSIEGISDEDAVKMGLGKGTTISINNIFEGGRRIIVEFEGDVNWEPFTGERSKIIGTSVPEGFVMKHTLEHFQDKIMEEVRR